MKFSIITPSFRSGEWLKLCIASVADQGVEVEHIVQDAGSDDGTLDWLPRDPRVKAFVEKDAGMYDAINRGLRRATGDVLAYLNCDEQYLPGALAAVQDYFERHPEIEVVLGDTVFVDVQDRYLCHRRAVLPGRYHTWVSGSMAFTTSATFFRRSVIEHRGLWFNSSRKVVGDLLWTLKLIEQRVPMGLLGTFASAFTTTGENASLSATGERERAELQATAPAWARWTRAAIVLHYRLRRLLAGGYSLAPFDYAVYTRRSPEARVTMHVTKPAFGVSRNNPMGR